MNGYEFMKRAGELSRTTQQLYYDFAKSHGVHYNTLAVLYTCYVNKDCTQKRVTVEWYVPKQTVNTVCKKLCAKGILNKVKSDGDHRETNISLTAEGEKFAAPIVKKLLAIESGIVERLGKEGALNFLEEYAQLREIMEEEFSKNNY